MSVRKFGSLLLALIIVQLSSAWAQEPTAGNRITGGQTIPQANFPPPVGSPPTLNPTVGQMGLNSTGLFNLGVGTLIGPQQVLFSAQTITDPNTGQLINPNIGTDLRFLLSGTTFAGRAVAIHPTWFGVLNPIIPAEGHFDLAILVLSQQVPNVTPTPLLRQVPPPTLLIGGFGDESQAGMCGGAITGLKPPPGLIQAATTNQIIPPSPTPTFLICNGGAVAPYPKGNVVTPGTPNVDYPVPVLPTQQFNDIGAPALILDPPAPGPGQAWKLAGIATFNTNNWSCGQRAFYVRLDVPQATQFIDQFINPGSGLPPPPPDADLAITSAALPANPVAGVPYTFTATILNQGLLDAGPFLVAAYIDNTSPVLSGTGADAFVQVLGLADPTPSPNVYKPPAPLVNGLKVGQTVTVTLTVTFKQSGKHTLKIQADPGHNVNESNIFNNTFLFQEKVLSPNVDLTIPFVIKQSVGGIDTGFTLVISNDGLGTAGAFTLGAFSNLLDSPDLALRQDKTIPLPVADLGLITVPGVPANSSVTVGVNLPNGATRNGRAWFWANLPQAFGNPLTPIAEDNTTNNITSATWGVTGGAVNITSPLSSTSNTGNVATVGNTVTFSVGGSATDANGAVTPLTFKWDFGDGSQAITNSPTVTHTYLVPGTYAVSVMISSGPNSTATSVVNFSATINPTVILGPVSVSAKRGSFSLKLPVPAIFTRKDRVISKLTSVDAGLTIRYTNNRVSGKLTSKNVGSSNFVVTYNAPKSGKQTQVTYTLVVTP